MNRFRRLIRSDANCNRLPIPPGIRRAYPFLERTILVLASGGVFTEDPWKPWDTVEPYLRQILGFIGITDVQTVRAQGTNIPALAPNAILSGEQAIAALTL